MVQEAQTMEIITLPATIQILPEIHPKTAVLSPNLRNPDMRIIRLMNRRRSLRKKRKEDITDFIMIRQHLPVLGRKAGNTITLAVIFGLVAGLVFQAVNMVSDKYFKKETQTAVGSAETLTSSASASTTAEESTDAGEGINAEIVANEKGPVAGVAQAAMPSVVAITSVSMQEIRSFFGYGMEYPSTGSGSGIIVGENDDELLIATNNHVVEGATTLSVCFIGSDVVSAEQETENYINGNGDLNIDGAVSAKIKGTDEDTDLAVIAVEKSDIPEETMSQIKIAQLGNSDDLAVGEQVVAIGNALGYGQTVTSGW